MSGSFLTGKPRPLGGELQFALFLRRSEATNLVIELAADCLASRGSARNDNIWIAAAVDNKPSGDLPYSPT
jgi:hypothetical protein